MRSVALIAVLATLPGCFTALGVSKGVKIDRRHRREAGLEPAPPVVGAWLGGTIGLTLDALVLGAVLGAAGKIDLELGPRFDFDTKIELGPKS